MSAGHALGLNVERRPDSILHSSFIVEQQGLTPWSAPATTLYATANLQFTYELGWLTWR